MKDSTELHSSQARHSVKVTAHSSCQAAGCWLVLGQLIPAAKPCSTARAQPWSSSKAAQRDIILGPLCVRRVTPAPEMCSTAAGCSLKLHEKVPGCKFMEVSWTCWRWHHPSSGTQLTLTTVCFQALYCCGGFKYTWQKKPALTYAYTGIITLATLNSSTKTCMVILSKLLWHFNSGIASFKKLNSEKTQ